MKLGDKYFLILIICLILPNYSFTEEKITTTPLLNIDKIQPSFEELNEENEKIPTTQNLKSKSSSQDLNSSQAILVGLDKITAKSSKLIVNLNEIK